MSSHFIFPATAGKALKKSAFDQERKQINLTLMNAVRDMFNQISLTYDQTNRVLSFGQDSRWRKKVARHLPLKPHLEILDLATGTGDQLLALFQTELSIRRAVGIDVAEEMMKIGRKKLKNYPQVEWIAADAQKLPFGTASFDAVTCSFGIRNVSEPLVSLKEAYRVLKPRGKCLILEFSMPRGWIRPLFLFYLRKMLPKLGGFLSKNEAAYRYLNRTIETFPSGVTFLHLLQSAGFSEVKQIRMNWGTVSLYIGIKS